jgi:hypothetical protein
MSGRLGGRLRGRVGDRESGAATLETTGVTIIAAILVVALLTAVMPQARIMGETYSYWICKVVTFGQGSCSPPSTSPEAHKPTEPCVLTANGVERNEKISVVVFTASDGRRIEVAQLSNGEYRVTVTDTGGAGLETGVGGGLSITVNDRTVGGSAVAGAGVSLDIKAGDVYYADADGMPDLMDALMQDQIKDTVAGDDGPIRWLTDQATDLVGVSNDLPEPDEVYAEGGISLNASAEATAVTDSAKAGLGASQMLGTRTNRNGTTTVYLRTSVSGEAGLQSLGFDTENDPQFQGARLEGKIEVVNAVTFDAEGNMVNVQATAAASGTSSGIASAMFGGDSDAALANQESGARIYQATLPIKDSTDQGVADDYLFSVGVGAIGAWTNPAATAAAIPGQLNFFQAAANRGTMTQQDYDTNSNTVFGVDATGKLGVELGYSGSVKEDSMNITDAQYYDGSQWVDWPECAA